MKHFHSAKVIGANVDVEAYKRTDLKRGDLDYPMSRSDLMSFVDCPARWRAGWTRPESKALANGSLVDMLLLTPEKFQDHYIECPATYETTAMRCPVCLSVTDSKTCRSCKCDREPVKITKDWDWKSTHCQEFREANKSKEPIKSEQMQDSRNAVQTALSYPVVKEILENSQRQVFCVAEYFDKATRLAIPVKVLLDIVPATDRRYGRYLFDFKTCRCAATFVREMDCANYGYACQAAMHTDVYCAATGEDRVNSGHIAQENLSPWHLETDLLSVEFVELGRAQYLNALAEYCRCLTTNHWPGYYAPTVIEGFRILQPPTKMLMKAQDMRPFYDEAKAETVEAVSDDLIP